MTTIPADTASMAPRQPNRYQGELRPDGAPARWIGRCRCGAKAKLEGTPLSDKRGDTAVLGADGLVYTTRILNSHESANLYHACGRWVLLRRVFDDGRPDSKRHTCGARCLNATGPSCDCRCRGANHGAGH